MKYGLLRLLLVTTVCTFAFGCATTREHIPRFITESHEVGAIQLPVLFKLDSATGEVWRYTGSQFIPVPRLFLPDYVPEPKSEEDIKAEKQSEAMLKKLHNIVLPKVDFRQAPIDEVAKVLTEASIAHDPDKKGVKISAPHPPVQLYKTPPTDKKREPPEDPFAATEEDDSASIGPPLVTFSASYITLIEALEIVTQVCDLKWRIKGDEIVIDEDYWGEDMVHWMYDVGPCAYEYLSSHEPQLLESRMPADDMAEGWKDFFLLFGIEWPAGSGITYVPLVGKLFVCNTPENHAMMDQAFKIMNQWPIRPGRFHLTTTEAEPGALLLMDTISGDVWKYVTAIQSVGDIHTIMKESFDRIPSPSRDISASSTRQPASNVESE